MTPEKHAEIQEIFDAAIALKTSLRSAYLEDACRGEPELRARLERLIEAADETHTVDGTLQYPTGSGVKECPKCWQCYEPSISVCPRDGTPLTSALPKSLLIDGKYQVQRRLGRGGMGAVYLVKHTGLEKQFALKLILTEGDIPKSYRESFETEARALGQLKHRNIVEVTDYGMDPNSGPYLVMEYLEGGTLRELLEKRGCLPFPEAIALLRQVADGIDGAHARHIVHGDLKPSNLFLVHTKDFGELVKVVDFGLARLVPPTEVRDREQSESGGGIRGTPPYMAPELFQAEHATPASDRFAFGALAYETLTGELPFGKGLREVIENLSRSPAFPSARNPNLPGEVDGALLALLHPEPDQRSPSALAAVDAMEDAWLRAEQRQWRAREVPRRLAFAALAAVLVALISVGAGRLQVAEALEERVADARFAMAPRLRPDPRLMVITVDDASLVRDQRPTAVWADDFGQAVNRLFTAGARAVGIDLLLPASWSQSPAFSRVVARYGDRLALAVLSAPSGEVIGTESVGPLTAFSLGDRYDALFGFTNLEDDVDHAIRHGRLAYLDRGGSRRPTFARRAVRAAMPDPTQRMPAGTRFRIDYAVRPADFPKISWKDVADRLNNDPDLIRNRLAIIGADYAGSGDEHRLPAFVSSTLVSGVVVQALIANTIARGLPVKDADFATSLAILGAICFGVIAVALRFPHRSYLALGTAAFAFCAYTCVAFGMFRFSRTMIAVVGPEFGIVLSAAVALVLKSYLAPYPTGKPSRA